MQDILRVTRDQGVDNHIRVEIIRTLLDSFACKVIINAIMCGVNNVEDPSLNFDIEALSNGLSTAENEFGNTDRFEFADGILKLINKKTYKGLPMNEVRRQQLITLTLKEITDTCKGKYLTDKYIHHNYSTNDAYVDKLKECVMRTLVIDEEDAISEVINDMYQYRDTY